MSHVRSRMIVAVSIGVAGSVLFVAGSIFEIAFWGNGNVLQSVASFSSRFPM
jgi:hypothetical protein